MKKAHIWNKNDKITADRLNSMSKPINALLDGGTGGTTQDKPHGDSDTANWANAIDDAQPVIHDKATWVGYRHPVYGTADLYENDGPIGIYATAPTVRDARGDIAQDIVHFGCMSCYLASDGCGSDGETVYLHVKTNCKGGLIHAVGSGGCGPKAQYIVGSASCNQWFGLNQGGGNFYFPVAKIGRDPKFECQKIAMQYNPIVIPLKADDVSYLPPYVMGSGVRGIQGMRMAQGVEQNIVPILGLNNHGGIKVLPEFDTDGTRRSNAIMASPELYGRATECEYQADQDKGGDPSIYKVDVPGTDEDGNFVCTTMYLYQPYNYMYPFASGDGGTLAKWPIYQLQACGKEKVKVGELKLNGGHIGDDDWQLWFQGCGEIVLPCGGLKLPAFGTAGTRQHH